MLETVDLSLSLPKAEFKQIMEPLGWRMADMQRQCRTEGVPVIIVMEGWDASGKGEAIGRLAAVLDPRGFLVHLIAKPTEDEALRPFLARYWSRLPARGQIAIFDHSWYRRVLDDRVDSNVPDDVWREAYDEIDAFESQLAADGYCIAKFWMHISKQEQKKRFDNLRADPAFAWRVGKGELRRRKQWDEYVEAVEEMLARTSTGQAPWTVVESMCRRYAQVKIMESVMDAMGRTIASTQARKAAKAAGAPVQVVEPTAAVEAEAPVPAVRHSNPLDHADLTLTLSRKAYSAQVNDLQQRLRRAEYAMYLERMPVVVVYEGWDAAGKGGNIKRLTERMDPRGYEVVPIGAPTPQELAHHYLRRFWIRLPKAGHMTIYDRSWYGRVMVERIEGFATEEEWRRAYQEINEFEHALARFGTVVAKFWIHISPDEQLRRFQERQSIPHKQWKITDEDWRNRDKWEKYYMAVGEMIQRTSTSYARWHIVEGDCKLWARVRALRTLVEAVESALDSRRNGNGARHG